MKNFIGPVSMPVLLTIIIGVGVLGVGAYVATKGDSTSTTTGDQNATSTAMGGAAGQGTTPAKGGTTAQPSSPATPAATGGSPNVGSGSMVWSFKQVPNLNQVRVLLTIGTTIYGIATQEGKCAANTDTSLYTGLLSSATCTWTVDTEGQNGEALYGIFNEGGKLVAKKRYFAPASLKSDFTTLDTLAIAAGYKEGSTLPASATVLVVEGQEVRMQRPGDALVNLHIGDIDPDSVYVEVIEDGKTRFSLRVANGAQGQAVVDEKNTLRVAVKSITGGAAAVVSLSLGLTIVE